MAGFKYLEMTQTNLNCVHEEITSILNSVNAYYNSAQNLLFCSSVLKNVNIKIHRNTGLFISPSGISELDCATTKTDTAERSISIRRESLQVFFCTRGLGVLPGSTARG